MSDVLETWEAERIDTVLEGGRTKPIVAECSRDDVLAAEEDELMTQRFVIKGIGNPEVHPSSLFNEVVGNLIARELGVNTPDPALIKITPEFAVAAEATLSAYGFSIQAGIASGAAYLGNGLIPPTLGIVAEDLQDQVARIYAFDLLVQNPDRRIDKPNCAYQKDRMIAFDFEMSFSFVQVIGASDPCDFVSHRICRDHFFRRALSSRRISWKPLLASLANLSDAKIEVIVNAVPAEWQRHSISVVRHLKRLKGQCDRIEYELQRSLV